MESILQLPASAISTIFSQVANDKNKVSWIRTPDYAKQLYVSPRYLDLWGIRPERLYDHPTSWNDTVTNQDVIPQLIKRNPNEPSSVYFNIIDADGNLKFVKDTCFHLLDPGGNIIAVAGISEALPSEQWEDEARNVSIILHEEIIVTTILNDVLKKKPAQENKTSFTRRETECIEHLSSGQSAKQIARHLSISPRTVEVHIDNVKYKLGCRTRIELISKLHSMHFI